MPSSPENNLQERKEFLIPCIHHFYRNPPIIVKGSGCSLFDYEGKEYFDFFSGVSVNHLGHCHPAVVEAIVKQVQELCHTTTIYLTEPILNFARKLIGLTRSRLDKVFFCTSGSEANEMAAALCQKFTGKPGILALDNGLHGNSKLTLSLTGIQFWKYDKTPIKSVYHATSPYCFRCPLGKNPARCRVECADDLEETIQRAKIPIGAFFLEIIQGNGGIVIPPQKWFDRLKEILEKHQILLVVDEVQSGLGRTGKMFAFEHFDLQPDIITLAKAIGGGLPAGATLAREDIAQSFNTPRASTFGGNCVVSQSGCAVIDTILKENLVNNTEEKGDLLLKSLSVLKQQQSQIGDVRGLGLMIGIELVDKDKNPLPELTDRILEFMKDRGYLIGKGGPMRNVLIFQPPLIIQQGRIEKMVEVLDQAFTACAGTQCSTR